MLDFTELSRTNDARKARWHSGAEEWTGADWSNAMCGEAGEAANVVKKLRRHETGIGAGPGVFPGAKGEPYNTMELLAKLADEIADVILYADLLASFYGIDTEAAVRAKFNRVSEAQDFPERI